MGKSHNNIYCACNILVCHRHILNEVAKNIALTGVEKITVVGDSNPEFLERIQSYNKHVDVVTKSRSVYLLHSHIYL